MVRAMNIDFLKPARMDDILDIVTAPEDVKGASVLLRQRVCAVTISCSGPLCASRSSPAGGRGRSRSRCVIAMQGGPGYDRRRGRR